MRPHFYTGPAEQKCGKDCAERGSRIEDREQSKLSDLPLKVFQGLLSLPSRPADWSPIQS